MRVPVTGAFGFTGTAVVRRLTSAGHEVVALTHRPPGAPLPPWWAGDVMHADICDVRAVRAAVSNVDAGMPPGSPVPATGVIRQAQGIPPGHATGTKTIVDALIAKAENSGQATPFVHASTHAVYGAPEDQPVIEDTPLAPASPYGRSKAAAEDTVTAASRAGALNAVRLRLFNIAGAVAGTTDTEQTRIIPKTLAVATGRAPVVEINGDGGAIRDFVHVQDAADAFLLALEASAQTSNAVYNVGATAARVLDIITIAEQVTGQEIPVIYRSPKTESPVMIADTTRIRNQLCWIPERSSLNQIITDAWEATLCELPQSAGNQPIPSQALFAMPSGDRRSSKLPSRSGTNVTHPADQHVIPAAFRFSGGFADPRESTADHISMPCTLLAARGVHVQRSAERQCRAPALCVPLRRLPALVRPGHLVVLVRCVRQQPDNRRRTQSQPDHPHRQDSKNEQERAVGDHPPAIWRRNRAAPQLKYQSQTPAWPPCALQPLAYRDCCLIRVSVLRLG